MEKQLLTKLKNRYKEHSISLMPIVDTIGTNGYYVLFDDKSFNLMPNIKTRFFHTIEDFDILEDFKASNEYWELLFEMVTNIIDRDILKCKR